MTKFIVYPLYVEVPVEHLTIQTLWQKVKPGYPRQSYIRITKIPQLKPWKKFKFKIHQNL